MDALASLIEKPEEMMQNTSEDKETVFQEVTIADITLHYEFTPETSAASNDVRHSMFGTTVKANLANHWGLEGELAVAKNNFSSYVLDGKTENLKGNGQENYFYNLGAQNLVEHSEQVFLGNI